MEMDDTIDLLNIKAVGPSHFEAGFAKKIFLKDWKEIRHNRHLFLSLLFFPLVIAGIMPLLLIGLLLSDNVPVSEMYAIFTSDLTITLKYNFLLIPVIVCSMIAGDSLAGEKERKTAETLLLLPVTPQEIYVGKVIAAVIPAIISICLAFVMMGGEVNLLLVGAIPDGKTLPIFGDATFWILAFLVAPLFSLVMVQTSVIFSARLSTAKAAQQVSMIFIIPVIALLFGSLGKENILSDPFWLSLLAFIFVALALVIVGIGKNFIHKERFIAC